MLLLLFLKKIYLFIFWLGWVFSAALRLSLVAVSRGTLWLWGQASHCGGFSCCGAGALALRKPVLERPSTTLAELENQVYYAGGPRGVNTSRAPLDKNPMPGHLFELHPVNEVNTKGQ